MSKAADAAETRAFVTFSLFLSDSGIMIRNMAVSVIIPDCTPVLMRQKLAEKTEKSTNLDSRLLNPTDINEAKQKGVGGVYVQKVDAEKLDNSEQRHKQQNRRQKENVPSFKTQKFIGNYKNYGIKPVDIKAVVSSRAENHRRKSSGICL